MRQTLITGLLLYATWLPAQPTTGQEVQPFPEDYTYELIADRLSCIEGEIPLHFNEKVYGFINYFVAKDRAYTRKVINRSTLYFPIIEKYLARYNLPDELKYLAVVESGLNPRAISRAGAGGLWQFMPYTGRMHGLHRDFYLDERLDPEKATDAACRYLSQLYRMFGDWELALAAYNSGPGNVRKAMRRSGYKKTFWEIYRYLPRETRSYVPQFVAFVYVFNYAQEHNLIDHRFDYLPRTDTVLVRGFVNLKLLAGSLGLCYEDLQKINPAIKRFGLKTEERAYPVRLPTHTVELFRQHRDSLLKVAAASGRKELEYLARHTVGSTWGRERVVYRVKSGDVLGTIAQRYRVRVSDIRKWNNLRSNLIRVGQRLNIWVYPGTRPAIAADRPKTPAPAPDYTGKKVYVVQPGDTLWDIARMHEGLSIEQLKKLNNLTTSRIKPGQKLIISP